MTMINKITIELEIVFLKTDKKWFDKNNLGPVKMECIKLNILGQKDQWSDIDQIYLTHI